MDEQKPTENQTEDLSEKQTESQIKKHAGNQESSKKQKETAREWIKKHPIITTIISGLIVTVVGNVITEKVLGPDNPNDDTIPYVTFMSDNMQVFQMSKKIKTLEYSVGGKSWEKLGTQSVSFGGNYGKLMIRGKNKKGTVIYSNRRYSSTEAATISFVTNAEVICSGDIRTLVDYKHYDKAETSEAKFIKLFSGCKQLVVAPELPAMDLAEECYSSMFAGCSSLKIAPELPAKKLTASCYSFMFTNCTSLKKTPELPAEKLANSCYTYMFSGCTSLTSASKLPADTLADYCYSGMFTGCISLYAPITLPATHLAKYCYQDMLSGCSSINQITMLAKEVVDNQCLRLLGGVSPSGVFYKNRNATWSNDGIVPEGWTVKLIDY